MRRLVIAGVASGVGKTTIACALMAAFGRRGRRVQPFKAGPDYIDPSHHAWAAGQTSRNLDSVLLPAAVLQALFARAAGIADIAIVEGVMGLFDGRNGCDEAGSTAEIARLVEAPVVVVIDAARMSRTAGAVALGCARFDPALQIGGFILNRVGSAAHARWATEAVEAATGLPVLGALPRDPGLALPERHLGLVPTAEGCPDADFRDRLADAAERHLALDRLWAIAEGAGPPVSGSGEHSGAKTRGPELFPPEPVPPRATIAVARDRAFSFYYEDSLDLLRAWGAEIAPFSPLEDRALPSEAQGVYVGGGFPELYAAELAENRRMHASLAQAGAAGVPIYAECGGLMYLGRSLVDFDGRRHEMVGLVPVDSLMQRRRVTLGYRSATSLRPSPLLEAQARLVGHEFHYSELASPVPAATAAYRLDEQDGALEGYAAGNTLASYVHVHFGSNAAMARRFIAACSMRRPLAPARSS